jgi:Family of unknown function (DUF6076)
VGKHLLIVEKSGYTGTVQVLIARGQIQILSGDSSSGRQALLRQMAATQVPLTAPVDDLLGLRYENEYRKYLRAQYGAKLIDSDDQLADWQQTSLPELFLDAAHKASQGVLAEELIPYLLKIRRRPLPLGDELPDDLPTLAAWLLDLLPRLKSFDVKPCALCHLPRLALVGEQSDYCRRPSPGHSTTCSNLERERRFRDERRLWRREYQRLHDRLRRGSLSETEWQAWKNDNSPQSWRPYEPWQAARKKELTRTTDA